MKHLLLSSLMSVLKLGLVVQDQFTVDLTVTPKSDEAGTSGESGKEVAW